jgi:hypothetical protein
MKALAAEMTRSFGSKLAPLNIQVKELTGEAYFAFFFFFKFVYFRSGIGFFSVFALCLYFVCFDLTVR